LAQATVVRRGGRARTGTRDEAAVSPPTRRRGEWRRTLALFLCFAGFYLLTTSGHFYAVDEETLYVLTESIGLHGTFAVPRGAWGLVLSPQSPAPGPAYSIFPPGQPFVALPLLWLGALVAPAFPADQGGYVLRFFVSLLNPIVTAATVALLYRLSRLLGHNGRVSLALAVSYGVATTAWPQGRTFFAEPLTALLLVWCFYCLRRGTTGLVRGPWSVVRSDGATSSNGRSAIMPSAPQSGIHAGISPLRTTDHGPRTNPWLALAGVAAAAALAVKPHAAIALPALGLYLLGRAGDLGRAGGRWHFAGGRALRACVAFGVGGGLVAAPYALLNWRLFGSPLSTGYGTSPLSGFTHPFLRGLYGLTFSTGRGIFWFSPPLFLALFGARRFFLRHRAEALACLGVVVAHYAFYCGHFEWAGGGAWGPRYLMIALPFAFLPLAGFLSELNGRRVLQGVAALVVAAGIVVQLLAVLTNFDFYMIGDEEEHNFVPAASPLLWHARTLNERVREWAALTWPAPDTATLRDGFLTRESEGHRDIFPRWTNGAGAIAIHAASRAPHVVKLTLFDHRPAALRDADRPAILVNGTPLPDDAIERHGFGGDGAGWTYRFTVPAAALEGDRATVTLRNVPWNPRALGLGDRDEDLGLFVHKVEVWRDGVPLTIADIPERQQIDPMPDTPRTRFWWFNNDFTRHHLTDNWAWYASVAGFPPTLTARWIGAFGGFALLLIGAGLVLGLRALPIGTFRRARRRRRRPSRPAARRAGAPAPV
jgi:hypothetical protein